MDAVRDALTACRAEPEVARSLPPAVYTDASVLEWEQRAIFNTGWVGVGRSDRWSPGTVTPLSIGTVGIVVSRDADGALHAVANTCRHRGAEVVLDEQHDCSRFRCGFHGWTYALDGRLVGAPHMQDAVGFDRGDHGLVRFPVEERHGFVFVSFDPDPPAIDGELADFDALHASWPVADMVTARRREFTVDCNWKLFAEVFNEYYHLQYVHPDSIGDTYLQPDPGDVVGGSFATQFGVTDGVASLLEDARTDTLPVIDGLAGRDATGVRYTWLFPTLLVAVGVDSMWMYEVYPDGPDRCRCAQVVAFPQASIDGPDFVELAEHYYERFDVAIEEDIPVLEQQQRGLRSPFAQQGPFSPSMEPSVARFADWYATRMLNVD